MTKEAISTERALRLALEALENAWLDASMGKGDVARHTEAITAVRVALASQGEALAGKAIEQPAPATELREQEPVAWLVDNGGDSILIRHSQNFPGVFVGSEFNKRPLVFGDTSPPAQPQQQKSGIANSPNAPEICDDPFAEIYGEVKKDTEVYTIPSPQRQQLPDGIPSPDELEALSDGNDGMLLNEDFPCKLDRLARWLREYAASPQPAPATELREQEPVTLGYMNAGHVHEMQQGRLPYGYVYPKRGAGASAAVYASPPTLSLAQRQSPSADTWVGLTAEDIRQLEKENTVDGYFGDYCPTWDLIEATEAKLKEKNSD